MHRLLVTSGTLACEEAVLTPEAARHLKVLRPRSGEPVELFDGEGRVRVYTWDPVRGALVAGGEPVREFPRPHPLVLFACITKGSRWDWTIEKAVELGVTRIVPVISDRCIVRIPVAERAAKAERWRRIAEDAARQSDAVWLPEVSAAVDFRAALAEVRQSGRVFVGALAEPPPLPLLSVLARDPACLKGMVGMFVGPEGDFTPEELGELLKIAEPVSFGPTILRAETAAIFGVSVLAAACHSA